MAKGCCGGSECGCRIISAPMFVNGRNTIRVTGEGTNQSPFQIRGPLVDVTDTTAIDLTLSYDAFANTYTIAAGLASTSKLDDLGDVVALAPTANQVLGWDSGSQKWTPRAPTAASAGAVQHDSSLIGDGSAGSQLQVRHASNLTVTAAAGITFTDEAINSLVRRFNTVAERLATITVPDINTLSITEDRPGLVDYWTGTSWKNLLVLTAESGDAVYEASGSYDNGNPTNGWNVLIDDVSDDNGRITVLSRLTEPLASAGGVLHYDFIPLAGYPFVVTYDTSNGDADIILYRYDSAALTLVPAAGAAVKGKSRVILY